LTSLFSEAPLGAICGQNIRMVKKKLYGPLDLVSNEAQTDASENDLAQVEYRQYVEWRASDAYVEWRAIETQTDDYVEWRAGAAWMEWWHIEARTKACDMAEFEYRVYVEMYEDWCKWRDSKTVDTVMAEENDESAEPQHLESEEVIVDTKTERKLLRAEKKLH
jgi:hypothetical protein